MLAASIVGYRVATLHFLPVLLYLVFLPIISKFCSWLHNQMYKCLELSYAIVRFQTIGHYTMHYILIQAI